MCCCFSNGECHAAALLAFALLRVARTVLLPVDNQSHKKLGVHLYKASAGLIVCLCLHRRASRASCRSRRGPRTLWLTRLPCGLNSVRLLRFDLVSDAAHAEAVASVSIACRELATHQQPAMRATISCSECQMMDAAVAWLTACC